MKSIFIVFFNKFFELSKKWQIQRMGFNCDTAKEKWRELRPLIVKDTEQEVKEMIERLDSTEEIKDDELTLFS